SDSPVDENTPPAPHDAYGRTKLDGERRLLEALPDAVVLRPPGIYGPRSTRDVVLHIAERIQRGRFFLLGDGGARRSWIFVETLVDALIHAATHQDLSGPFLVDDGRPVSRRELATEVARALGVDTEFRSMPLAVARAAVRGLELVLGPLGIRQPYSEE